MLEIHMVDTENVVCLIPEEDAVAGRGESIDCPAVAHGEVDLGIIHDPACICFFLRRLGACSRIAVIVGHPSVTT